MPQRTSSSALPQPRSEDLLQQVGARLPAVQRALRGFGESPVGDYLQHAFPAPAAPLQPRDSLFARVYEYLDPLLGPDTAQATCAALEADPTALTANHQGTDYFAQSVQGSLLFALRDRAQRAAPVFACGGVPLDNITYPMGVLLYGAGDSAWETTRLPIFSNRFRRELVSVVQPFDAAMVQRAGQRLARMNGNVAPAVASTLDAILEQDYASPQVLQLPDYSAQSVILNQRIWQRLFAALPAMPQPVTLELEKLTSALLLDDLNDRDSLAAIVTFEPACRAALSSALDGATGCWEQRKLAQRLADHAVGAQVPGPGGGGTFLYWAIDPHNRRVPLYLDQSQTPPRLRGVDDRGASYSFELTPAALCAALRERRLLPSLFSCFLSIAFARAITCAGAYYQAGYLPVMQAGLDSALCAAGYADIASNVAQVPCEVYLGGMQTVMQRCGTDALVPAGPTEIAAAGGLDETALEKLLGLSVRNAHLASLFDTVPDVLPRESLAPHWQADLAAWCYHALREQIVVI